jgi:hypothetical protein
MKVGQPVEIKIGVRMDHAAHDGPLLGRVAVALHLGVDDGKAVVLNGLPGAGELLGDGVEIPLLFHIGFLRLSMFYLRSPIIRGMRW